VYPFDVTDPKHLKARVQKSRRFSEKFENRLLGPTIVSLFPPVADVGPVLFFAAETLLGFGAHLGGKVFIEIEVEFQNGLAGIGGYLYFDLIGEHTRAAGVGRSRA
jgi:hypothetical protein